MKTHFLSNLEPTLASLFGVLAASALLLMPHDSAFAQTRPTLASLQRAIDCLNQPTDKVFVSAMDRGTYKASGKASGSELAPSLALAGRFVEGTSVLGPYRSYFVFKLADPARLDFPQRGDVVVAAVLYGVIPRVNGFVSDATDTLTLIANRVTTSPAALMDGTAGAAAYLDLADGPIYGTYVASKTEGAINMPLSSKALLDINETLKAGFSAMGDYRFAIGGSIAHLGVGVDSAVVVLHSPLSLELTIRRNTVACPQPQ